MPTFIASAAFGIEGITLRELRALGFEHAKARQTGGVEFDATPEDAFRAAMWLRTSDRVMLRVAAFEARSFEELFNGVRAQDWARFIPRDAAFPVRAHCARSQLMSPSDCQSIVKKAVVESLRAKYNVNILPETAETYQIDISIHKDLVTLSLDMCGLALNKRGYRTQNGEAALRETLAAALLLSSRMGDRTVYDPCCGTGTLLIEAAMIRCRRAAGLSRDFACESWRWMDKGAMLSIRNAARDAQLDVPLNIAGSDIDPAPLKMAQKHVEQAGFAGRIPLTMCAAIDAKLTTPTGLIITNPPYGERMQDKRGARAVAEQLRRLKDAHPGWSLAAFTADTGFESAFGARADSRRRFYNGRLECELLIYDANNRRYTP